MPFESSSIRLWRSLDRPVRDRAAHAFWNDPPQEAAALAVQEIVKLLRVHLLVFGVLVLVLAGLAFGLFSTAHVGSDGIDLGGGHHGHHEGAEAPVPEAK